MFDKDDLFLERLTADNHTAAVNRLHRANERASKNVADCMNAERRALRRRRRAAYRSAFHVSAFLASGCLIWGLSEISTGRPIAGLLICAGAGIFGLTGCIMDCLGGGR